MTAPFLTARQALAQLERRELSSVELLDHYLERIERLGDPINPFVTLEPELAREEARKADQERAAGRATGVLHGLPMTVKDCFETAGMRTTCGFEGLAGYVPQQDAEAVARLRAAGAVIFGKTNLPTFAADGQSFNPVAGTTNNPWDLSRSPSGSSGGAAAALAMGFTPLELGSDISGSIRLPAHACGVFGLKPSYRAVPLAGHIPGPPGSAVVADMNVAGPLARDAGDLELAFDVVAGPGAADDKAWRLELPPPRRRESDEYRLLVWLDDEACPVDHEVLETLRAAIDRLDRAGANLEEGRGPVPLADAIRVHRTLLMGVSCSGPSDDQFAHMVGAVRAGAAAGDDDASRHLRWLTQSKRDWNAVNEERAQMTRRWAEFFERYDAVLCPVGPVAAIPHDQTPVLEQRQVMINGEPREYWDQVCWISMASACYLPAVSVPVGLTASGLPVGLQIIAPYLEDRTALDLARRVADVTGGFVPPPEPEPAAMPAAQA